MNTTRTEQLHTDERRIATKAYTCTACQKAIKIGTKYVFQTEKISGSFRRSRMHEECHGV